MRVLQLVQQPLRRGGEIFAAQLSEALRRVGHEVTTTYLYDADDGPDRLFLQPGDEILGGDPSHFTERTFGTNPVLLRMLRGRIDRHRPDIVQLNGARSVKYGAMLRRVSRHATFRTVYRNIGSPRDWIRGRARRAYYRWGVFPGIDGVAALSARTLVDLRGLGLEVPTKVIPTGVSASHLAAHEDREVVRRRLGAAPGDAVVVYVGRLSPEKRVDRLLRGFADAARGLAAACWIVGDGPERGRLQDIARAANLETVRFMGAVDDVGTYLRAADLAALTSDTEGVPAVLLEAGFCGLPVLATAVGAIPDTVRDGIDGWIVAQNDASVARALTHALRQPEERALRGDRLRARVLAEYTIERVAESYLSLYREVLANKHDFERRR